MASIKLRETKDGRRFFQIAVSRGYGKAPYKTRWYWPDGWSKRSVDREVAKVAAEFERACAAGEVMNRAQKKEKAAQEAEAAAKLKTVRQYSDGVFMPTKETTISENTRSSYRMYLDKHILPGRCGMLRVFVWLYFLKSACTNGFRLFPFSVNSFEATKGLSKGLR